MPDAHVVEWIREKYHALVEDLDERGRRRWAAAEARSLGRGGIAAVAAATGISDRTIRNGMLELENPDPIPAERQRRSGAGRPSREHQQPELIATLQALVDAGTRGDPMTPIRWVCHSTRELAKRLHQQGFPISSTKVGQLLRTQGYSLQANRKTVEGKQHPDRDAQFQHTTFLTRNSARRFRMAFTTSHATKPGYRWASAMTRPNSPWLPFDAGGAAWAENATLERNDF